jgi:methenyltetrahydromethanopterin cyclohydrolase
MHPLPPRPSVNGLAAPLVDAFAAEAASLRLRVEAKPGGPCLIDAGAAVRGSVEAGRRIAEICLAGLGRVTITPNGPIARWPFSVQVQTADPVLACLGSQYAGWSLKGEDGFFALGSGPGRAAAATESLFEEIGYHDRHERITLVLEAGAAPPSDVVAYVAREAGVPQEAVTFIYAPTQSLAGSTQVVARVLEVALHKVHTLGFPLDHIVDGLGTAPIAPPGADFVQSMGRTNDAIIYGGRVQLFVTGEDADARSLAEALPSITSRDYGAPFADIFSRSGGDFYAIDPHLFSPAEVIVSALESGRSFRAGQLAPDLVDASFS